MQISEVKIGEFDCLEVPGDPKIGTIVLLHGYGATNHDLAPLSRVYQGPRWLFPNGPIEIPIAADYTGRGWFPLDLETLHQAVEKKSFEEITTLFSPELTQARETFATFLDALETPLSKLTLGGFSQGAILSLETTLNLSEKIKALLLFSGTIVHKEVWKAALPRHQGLPFFMSHGRNDEMLPFKMAEELEKLLQEGGLEGKLHPFTGGHEIPFSLLLDLQPFLAKHLGDL